MIELRIRWKRSGLPPSSYLISLFQFGNEKTRAVVEALNDLSENPIDVDDLLERWPLGNQEERKV